MIEQKNPISKAGNTKQLPKKANCMDSGPFLEFFPESRRAQGHFADTPKPMNLSLTLNFQSNSSFSQFPKE